MKKFERFLAVLLAAVMALSLCSGLTVLADDDTEYSGTCGDNLTWEFDEDTGTLTISGSGEMEDYSSGGSPWYSIRSSIIYVIIEDGVTSIGSYIFYGCNVLTSITIPDSVISIGDYAFYGCSDLTSITIPDSVTSIGAYAFAYCSNNLVSITIPDSVTSIGNHAFYDCNNLGSITIPDSVTSIEDYTFAICNSLTSITIPDSVTSIGESAFEGCNSLTSITIPDSVTSIGESAFVWCNGLTNITISNSVTSIGSYVFAICSSLTSIAIPDSVISIGYKAFYACTSLTSITIPDSVTSIGAYAFDHCSSLTSITIPSSVTSIGYGAFEECNSLSDVYYTGSEDDWAEISIEDGNDCLTSATIHYNSTYSIFESGDGSEENPWQVATEEQLWAVRNDLDAYYIQVADIDLSGIEWVPIGTYADPFTGSYDGNGYEITNMSITEISEDIYGDQSGSGSSSCLYIGLFGYADTDSSLNNITLYCDIDIDLYTYIMTYDREYVAIGGICGSYHGETLTSCVVSGNISASNVSEAKVGGIVGACDSDIYNCVNYADITVEGKDYSTEDLGSRSEELYCGGITGSTMSVYGDEITYCLNYGDICASSGCSFLYCGGISGEYGAISYCINYGDISGSIENYRYYSTFAGNTNVGGIVGATSSITNSNCINYGNISAEGDPDGEGSSYAGGIIGYLGYYGMGNISNCYNLGQSITAETSAGRIAGELISSSSNTDEIYSLDSTLVNDEIPDESETGAITIHGISLTEDEMSIMISDLYSEIMDAEYFIIGEDTNCFSHTEGLMSDYSTGYLNLLLDEAASNHSPYYAYVLQRESIKSWNGSCEGISRSMIYTSLSRLTSLFGETNYWDLGSPQSNETLYDVINYYQLAQYLPCYEDTNIVYNSVWGKIGGGMNFTSLEDFLSDLVEEAQKSEEENIPFLFSYNRWSALDEENEGHCVVVCGYECDSDGNHIIQIYDMNILGTGLTNDYLYMTVASDYSSFSYEDAAGLYYNSKGYTTEEQELLQNTWNNMSYIGIDDMTSAEWDILTNAEASSVGTLSVSAYASAAALSDSTEDDENTVTISFSAYQEFTLTNAEGQTLVYDGENYSGDMEIYSIKIAGEGSPQFYITTDASDSFVLTGFEDGFEVSVEIDGRYYTASSSGADTITLSLDGGVVIEGDSYSFTGGMSVSLDSADLVCFSGEAEGTCSISLTDSGIVLEAEDGCSDVTVETYSEAEYESTDIDQEADKITVSDDEDGSVKIEIAESDAHIHSWTTVTTSAGSNGSTKETYTCSLCGEEKTVTSLYGSDRYKTAEDIVESTFESCKYAVIADGSNFPDALAAASLAGALDAPILITSDSKIQDTIEELKELGVTNVYIVGGTSSVSAGAQSAIEAEGITASRISGSTRQLTAVAVAEEVLTITGGQDVCLVATGSTYADALAASPYAYWSSSPIYLTNNDGSISAAVLASIEAAGYSRIVIIGGTASVTEETETALSEIASVTRLGGSTRYDTAAEIAEWSVEQGMSYNGLTIATGTNYPDALTASALCGQNGSVLLLSAASVSGSTALEEVISENADSISDIYIVGGYNSVSAEIRELIADEIIK